MLKLDFNTGQYGVSRSDTSSELALNFKTYLNRQAFQLHQSNNEQWKQRLGIFALFIGQVIFDIKRASLNSMNNVIEIDHRAIDNQYTFCE